ncbi:LysE family transporter [Vibrio sp. 10N.222.49.A3]
MIFSCRLHFYFSGFVGFLALTNIMDEFSTVIKFVGITYLFWLAHITWTYYITDTSARTSDNGVPASTVGLLITLLNPRAIWIYGLISRIYRFTISLCIRYSDDICDFNVFCGRFLAINRVLLTTTALPR